jgi:hypothetical protein
MTLSYVRSELLEALNVFLNHLKYTITFMSSICIVAFSIFTFGYKADRLFDVSTIISVLLLIMVYWISGISKKITRRYYKIYVSNYIYSARLHEIHGSTTHPWNKDIYDCKMVVDIWSDEAVDEFIESTDCEEKHSWYYYSKYIDFIRWFAPITGLALSVFYIIHMIFS